MEPVARTAISYDLITIVFMVVLGVIWLAKSMYYNRFVEFLQLPLSSRYFSAVLREKNLENPFTLVMISIQVISFSLLIWYGFQLFTTIRLFNMHQFSFWVILGAVSLFVFLKIVLQVIIAAVFKIESIAYQYLYTKINYLNFSALILLVGLAFSIYNRGANDKLSGIFTYVHITHQNLSTFFLYASIFVFLLVNLIGWITLVKNYQKLIFKNLLYIILYLCAFEIAPLLILGGYVTNY